LTIDKQRCSTKKVQRLVKEAVKKGALITTGGNKQKSRQSVLRSLPLLKTALIQKNGLAFRRDLSGLFLMYKF